MKGARYWLFNWLDANHITDTETAKRALSERSVLEDLKEVANQETPTLEPIQKDEPAILAGRILDLSGNLDCDTPSCRELRVNTLFRKAWHYFDRIIVADVVRHEMTHHWEFTIEHPTDRLLAHLAGVIYLRKIGAEDLVDFREKPPCWKDWASKAQKLGFQNIVDAAQVLKATLERESRFFTGKSDGNFLIYKIEHTEPDINMIGQLPLKEIGKLSKKQLKQRAIQKSVDGFARHLLSDVITAKLLGVPLGSIVGVHGKLLSDGANGPSPADVAFKLDLPVLNGVPIDILTRVRRDEKDSFQRFRDSLRTAIKERLNNSTSNRSDQIAEQIRLDIIEPELRRIRDRLHAAEMTLTKKSALGIFMGALVTTCGILSGIPGPTSIAAGIGTMVTTETSAANKYLEEKQDISLSCMYFLWKTVEHSHHNL